MGKVFRRAAFGGFNKKEVIEYLDSLNQEQKLREARDAEDMFLLEKQVGALTAQLGEAEERVAALRAAAEEQASQMKAREAELEAKVADIQKCLDTALADQTQLRRTVTQLEDEKNALVGEKLALIEEKNRLTSRILDFDDERRVFEAERQQAEQEMAEQRRELESRIFDLEAEVLESLEHQSAQPRQGSDAFARRIAQALAQPQEDTPPREARPAESEPAVAGTPTKKAGGRVIVRRPGQPIPEPAPEPPPVSQAGPVSQPQQAQKEKAKLGSVRDILRYVRNR